MIVLAEVEENYCNTVIRTLSAFYYGLIEIVSNARNVQMQVKTLEFVLG